MSENKDSPKDVQSSLGAHTTINKASALSPVSLEPNELNKGSHESLDKMSYLSHKQGKGWHTSHHQFKWQKMVICSRPPQADDTFVAMDALAEKDYVEDFTANRIVTAKSFSCVFDPTFVFLSLLLLGLIPGFQNRN